MTTPRYYNVDGFSRLYTQGIMSKNKIKRSLKNVIKFFYDEFDEHNII